MRKINWVVVFTVLLSVKVQAVHQQSVIYEWPKDEAVKTKPGQWQDRKFGMLIHPGSYAAPGITQSRESCSGNRTGRGTTGPHDDFPIFDPKQWIPANGTAIYRARITAGYHEENPLFNQSRDQKFKNAIYCFKDNSNIAKSIKWSGNASEKGSKMILPNADEPLKWELNGNTVKVYLSEFLKNNIALYGALAFSYPV